jgi:hypothetical protein
MVHLSYTGILALTLALAPVAVQDLTLTIPPVRTSFDIDNQPVTITASGTISRVSHGGGGEEVFRLRLTADLADLQANMTAVLSAQLDRSDRCGDRIAIQNATLAPADPASLLTTRLHYERWACVKALGKQITSRLAGGDAVVKVKITPSVEADRAVKLEPEVGEIEADGSLGELLRSGSLGDALRQKLHTSLESALEKGAANLNATLPPAAQSYAAIRRVEFRDAGAGRLEVVLVGEIRIPAAQVPSLLDQIKQRAASR